LGQSGGVSIDFVNAAFSRKIGLNKAVSYGNQIDLRVGDFLGYLAGDDSVTTVAAYIEDVKDGKGFLRALREASTRKPVIILKGGATEQGARAAASHTGAMAGSYELFSGSVRQHGGIVVETFEQLLHAVMLATAEKRPRGPRLGFLGAGGGTSVLLTDAAGRHGLSLPVLEGRTQKRIREAIADVNTSATNPVDLGAFGLDFDVMTHAMKAMDEDANVDAIVPYFSMDFLARFFREQTESGIDRILEAVRGMEKPVIPIVSRTTDDLRVEEVRLGVFSKFREAGLAVYNTVDDAVYAIGAVLRREGSGSSSVGRIRSD
jgi:acetyl-CoA synthetase (ADP-forming)/acetyltransferase